MKISKALLLGTTFAALIFCSCSSTFSRGKVYRDWSLNMSEMGIFPVYPPREDIVVGDVYALPLHPYDSAAVGYIGGLGSTGIHVEYLGDPNQGWTNISGVISNYYRARPYPADTTNGFTMGTNDSLPLVGIPGYAEPNRNSVFEPGSVARLRQVAFPDFSVTTIDQASLSAVVPIEAIMAGFNFSHDDIKAVHFKLPQAESYGITAETLLKEVYQDTNFACQPDGSIYLRGDSNAVISVPAAQMAYGMFRDTMETLRNDPTRKLPCSIRRHLFQAEANMRDKIYLALISEVYFTRSIDISIECKRATGGSIAGRPITASELKQLQDWGLTKLTTRTNSSVSSTNAVTNTATNSIIGTKAEMIDLSEGDTAYDLARKLRNLDVQENVANIGGMVKVLYVSANNIGLRRTFARPVVVGVRGVLIKVDVNHPFEFADDPNIAGVQWMKVEGTFGRKATILHGRPTNPWIRNPDP